MEEKYILALDQGTTSSRAIVFDQETRVIKAASREFKQIYPKPGWVEHNPEEIWESQKVVCQQVLKEAGITARQISAIGITNQRETTILWDKDSGVPVHNAVVWQCRRSASICDQLKQDGLEVEIQRRTGLVCDAYFSASKIRWLLENDRELEKKARRGKLLFGTVDSWLLYRLTEKRVHATDFSNASRTMLFNIHDLAWDEDLLKWLHIPPEILPEVLPSSHFFGVTGPGLFAEAEIPISGIAGDQQAALFGQGCFEPGMVKSTYGTGSFILMNTGSTPVHSESGLIATIACGIEDEMTYALEGSIFVTGAAIQWLRDELKIIDQARDSECVARQVDDTGGAYMVPAFAGLGAPHWDMYARGAIVGLTRGTNRNHLVRATLESLAYQVRDVIDCMEGDSGIRLKELKVDGGASANDFLMQFQADILGVPVVRPKTIETTARGAAFLAGLTAGVWRDREELGRKSSIDRRFVPEMTEKRRKTLYRGWRRAVERAKAWEVNDDS